MALDVTPVRPDGSPIVDDRTSGPRYEPFRWLVEECPDELRGLSSAALVDALTRGLRFGRVEMVVDSVTGDPLGGVKVSGRVKTGYRTLREIREEKLQKGNSHA